MLVTENSKNSSLLKKKNVRLRIEISKKMRNPFLQVVFVENKNHDSYRRWSKQTLEQLNRKYRKLQFPEEYTNYEGSELQLSVDLETLERADKWVAGKSKETLANWEAWRFISDEVPYFGDYFAHRTKVFERILEGNREEETKWTKCVRKTASSLGFALGALYQREYVSQSSLKDLIVMLDNVKQQFSEFIQKVRNLSIVH